MSQSQSPSPTQIPHLVKSHPMPIWVWPEPSCTPYSHSYLLGASNQSKSGQNTPPLIFSTFDGFLLSKYSYNLHLVIISRIKLLKHFSTTSFNFRSSLPHTCFCTWQWPLRDGTEWGNIEENSSGCKQDRPVVIVLPLFIPSSVFHLHLFPCVHMSPFPNLLLI